MVASIKTLSVYLILDTFKVVYQKLFKQPENIMHVSTIHL